MSGLTRVLRAIRYRGRPPILMAFGGGDKVSGVGYACGRPAVFLYDAKHPGTVGAWAPLEPIPTKRLRPGDVVLTFPTVEQAEAVWAAITTRALAAGPADERGAG